MKSDWVKCSDWMPGYSEEVFIYPYKSKWPKYQRFGYHTGAKWMRDTDDGYAEEIPHGVTHWMPLPEPPQEAGGGGG